MAVEYQLPGSATWTSVSASSRNTGRSEARFGLMVFNMLQKWENDVAGVLVTLITGVLRG